MTATALRFGVAGMVELRPFAALIVQVWAETMRNDMLATTLDEGYTAMRAAWSTLVDAYREAGLMPADVPADHVARTMIATAQGFIAQEALFGGVEPEILENGLHEPMSMTSQRPS